MRHAWMLVGMSLGALALPLRAAQQNLAGTEVGARFLNLPGSARASALGGAVGASQGSLDALGVNPAALVGLEAMQASFTHSMLMADSHLEHVGVGLGLGGSTLGLGVDYLSYGSVNTYSLDAGGFPVAGETLRPYALGLNLGYAQPVAWGLSLGVSAKWVSESLGPASVSALGFDFGARWQAGDSGLSFGASALDFGTALDGAALPSKARLTTAFAFGEQLPWSLLLSADLLLHVQDRGKGQIGLGLEFSPLQMMALRAGYRAADADGAAGAVLGLGFKRGWLALDYAYDFAGALGATQRFSLSVTMPKAAATVAEESTPALEAASTPDPAQALVAAVASGDEAALRKQTEAIIQGDPSRLPETSRKVDEQGLMPAIFSGNFLQAERAAEAMTQIDPQNARAFQALGGIKWHRGDVAACLANFKKAYALDPSRDYLKVTIQRIEAQEWVSGR